jgi:hypothetical protein
MPAYPAFVGGSYPAQAWSADVERTVNFFVEKHASPGASSPAALISTPGFQVWSQGGAITDVVGRATKFVAGRLFMVIGAGFYEFDAAGVSTKRGNLAQDANPAQIAYNGLVGGQLLIASGSNGYCYVLATNVLTLVLVGDCTMVVYCQGFFLAFNIATGRVRLSALNDGTTWPGAQFFQRSLFGDPWQAMFVDGNNLIWLPGLESFEVWNNTGTGTQPFAPLSGLTGLYGIAAPFAFSVTPTPTWLTQNADGAGVLASLRSGGIQPLSNYAFSTKVSMYARTGKITDAELLPYQDQQHTFLTLAFPTPGATWAYDYEGDGWAERGKWNVGRGDYDLWAPRTHVYAFGKHLIGDRSTGTVWHMDTSFATETDGTGIRVLRRAPAITREGKRLPVDRLQLLMDTGVGLAGVGQGSDPQIMLRVSGDGGRTWGSERRAGFGRIGDFKRRVFWTRLGASENLAIEVTCSDPVPKRISAAWINPTENEGQVAA